MDWLMDKLLVRFGRHEAPVILGPEAARPAMHLPVPGRALQPAQPAGDQRVVRRGRAGGSSEGFLTLADTLSRVGFVDGLPNLGKPCKPRAGAGPSAAGRSRRGPSSHGALAPTARRRPA